MTKGARKAFLTEDLIEANAVFEEKDEVEVDEDDEDEDDEDFDEEDDDNVDVDDDDDDDEEFALTFSPAPINVVPRMLNILMTSTDALARKCMLSTYAELKAMKINENTAFLATSVEDFNNNGFNSGGLVDPANDCLLQYGIDPENVYGFYLTKSSFWKLFLNLRKYYDETVLPSIQHSGVHANCCITTFSKAMNNPNVLYFHLWLQKRTCSELANESFTTIIHNKKRTRQEAFAQEFGDRSESTKPKVTHEELKLQNQLSESKQIETKTLALTKFMELIKYDLELVSQLKAIKESNSFDGNDVVFLALSAAHAATSELIKNGI
jgi:hypothetical protein